jgi:hypothetical protein
MELPKINYGDDDEEEGESEEDVKDTIRIEDISLKLKKKVEVYESAGSSDEEAKSISEVEKKYLMK